MFSCRLLNGEQTTANGKYIATAYNQHGLTASGLPAQRHLVAADPAILPIGTRIKIRRAGRYSGEYVVADTGEKIEGRRLDIFIPSEAACRKFGKKTVRVRVIQIGNGTREETKQAQTAVKEDVKKELEKKAVGSAATEADWAARKSIVGQGSNAVRQGSNTSGASPPPPSQPTTANPK